MTALPTTLYRAAQVRELDRIAIEEFGIPGSTLMEHAGEAAFHALRQHWPEVRRIVAVCGLGNNGGDGYVVARLAAEAGLEVTVLQVGDAQHLRGDALQARGRLDATATLALPFEPRALGDADLIVDALLGTGLKGEPRGAWREAIEVINSADKPVLAVDIPSGLDADTGCMQGAAVRAALTVTFIGLKQGMVTADGPDHCGVIQFNDLGVPSEVFNRVTAAATRIELQNLPRLSARQRNSHKGDYGRLLVIGGEHGMAGALRLCGEAALRVGAGLVYLATRADHAAVISAQRPELLCYGVERPEQLTPLLERTDVIAIGPGLGQSEWASQLLARVLDTGLPLVVDADALNLLALEPLRRDNWVLTPHPGEAARLLKTNPAEIQSDRYSAAAELQKRYGGVVVLKGAGTLVVTEQGVEVCSAGNPGMASAGMGDVLTGVIAGLIAQGLSLEDAARRGVCLHAAAGDKAAEQGESGLIATDLLPWVRSLLNLD
ncbi:MAG TPA: NAD(P)H-hydrate dehydratase [Gammaproteobacteria bacterium]|nr:NAD(P)H-hydrate dehydratase [Gammaproteobacteria bacterium]